MSAPASRAATIAASAGVSLLAPISGVATAAAYAVLGLIALAVPPESVYFDRLARPAEVRVGRLVGLAGFAFGVAIFAAAGIIVPVPLPSSVFVMAVLLVAGALVGDTLIGTISDRPLVRFGGITLLGGLAGLVAFVGIETVTGLAHPLRLGLYLATTGALASGLLTAVMVYGEDPLSILAVGPMLWLFATIGVESAISYLLLTTVLTTVLGLLAYRIGVASIAGMLSGVLFGVITAVYGGIAWFLVLVCFFVVGGLATRYRYEEKTVRGVAEPNEGARGSRNVFGNSLIAIAAVVGSAAAPQLAGITRTAFAVLFAAAVATALADTLSSEIGGLFDDPRLITTLDPVKAGTDGAITVQGSAAGVAGAGVIGVVAWVALPGVGLLGGVVVTIGGTIGMGSDSLFGATLEGPAIGNEGVNILATLVGGVVGVGTALAVGIA